MAVHKKLKVTLVKSVNRRTEKQRACVRGLGLRRINHAVWVMATPCNLGMINKVSFLLKVEGEDSNDT